MLIILAIINLMSTRIFGKNENENNKMITTKKRQRKR